MTQTQQFFGVTQAAQAVGCAENTLRNLANRGIILPQRLVGANRARYLFTQADIDAARAYLERARAGARA